MEGGKRVEWVGGGRWGAVGEVCPEASPELCILVQVYAKTSKVVFF